MHIFVAVFNVKCTFPYFIFTGKQINMHISQKPLRNVPFLLIYVLQIQRDAQFPHKFSSEMHLFCPFCSSITYISASLVSVRKLLMENGHFACMYFIVKRIKQNWKAYLYVRINVINIIFKQFNVRIFT